MHVEACISKLVGNPVYTTQTQNPTCNRKIYSNLNMFIIDELNKEINHEINKINKINNK